MRVEPGSYPKYRSLESDQREQFSTDAVEMISEALDAAKNARLGNASDWDTVARTLAAARYRVMRLRARDAK